MDHGLTLAQRARRGIVAAGAALAVAITGVLLTAPAALADVPTTRAPLLEPDDTVVTADALPTVQINDGYVWAQTTVGNAVYAVGSFKNARAAGAAPDTQLTSRNNVLAYDIRNGNLLPFAPQVNGVVRAVVASPDGSRIYIGGSFDRVNGQSRFNIAALDAVTGQLVSGWQPSAGGTAVYALAATASTVYAGGLFTQGNGVARQNLASFAAANGALQSWAPQTDLQVDAMVMEPGNQRVIIGGRFYAVNGQVQRGLAALDPATGAIDTNWAAPNTVVNGWNSGGNAGKAGIFALSADSTGVYGTGWVFADVNTGNLEGTFAADAGTGAIRWVADCHGDHYGVFANDKAVYVTSHTHACDTASLWPEQNPRTYRYVEAYTPDARGTLSRSPNVSNIYKDWSGTPSPSAYNWFPDFTTGTTSGLGQAGLSITGTKDGQYISIAGEFGSVNNQRFQGLVRFSTNPTGGAKQGPRLSGATFTPTATSSAPGVANVTIPKNWDRDSLDLTYELFRAGTSQPVATQVVPSTWWDRSTLTLRDTSAPPGSSPSYTVRVSDSDGNRVTSPAATVTIASGQASAYGNQILRDDPSIYWPLGNHTTDWAGANNPVYGSGVSVTTPGAIQETGSSASVFNGTGDGRVSSTNRLGSPPDTFSVELWFRTDTTRGGKLIGYGREQTGNSGSYDRHVYMTDDGRLVFGVYPGGVRTVTSPASYNDNRWHQMVATLGENGMQLFVDGALVASDASVTSGEGYLGYWRVGGDNISGWPSQPSSFEFSGSIDEVAVYSKVLTAAQVSAHRAAGLSATAPTASFTQSAENLVLSTDASGSSAASGESITGYAWNFGDGDTATGRTTSHTYTNPGTYTVTLTVTDSQGLTSSTSREATVSRANVAPVARFTSAEAGLTSSVDGSGSTDSDGTIASYSWNWGDDSDPGTGATASHRYAAAGTYTITLTVTDDRGATHSTTREVTVTHADPVATFSAAPNGLSVGVDASASTASDGATLSYAWDWGDNTAAGSGRTASHDYAAAGTYTITLTVTDSLGATRTTTRSVTVSDTTFVASDSFGRTVGSGWGSADVGGVYSALYGPASAATVGSGVGTINLAAGQTRNMVLQGVSVRDVQATVRFAIGAAASTGNSYAGIATRQSASQDYTVRAWKRTDGSVWLVAQRAGTVLVAQPIAGLTWASGDQLQMRVEVTGANPTTIRARIWKVGSTEPSGWQISTTDSTAALQSAGWVALHGARAASATSATAVVFDDFRVVNAGAPTPPANTAPVARFTSQATGLQVAFDGSTSSDAEGAIASYAWDFGDGSAVGTGVRPSRTYDRAGTYQVRLTVTDSGGLIHSVTRAVTVEAAPPQNAAPVARFTSQATGLQVVFDGSTSSDAEGPIASYAWDFGDGSAAGSGVRPSRTYDRAGTYQVRLTVTDSGGLTHSATNAVTVTAAQPEGPIARDAFGRTVGSGWGTAEVGGAWTVQGGPASSLAVGSGVGTMSLAAGQTRNALLASTSVRDVEILTTFSLAQAPTTGNTYLGIIARQIGSDNYQVRAWLRSDGSVWLVTQRGGTVLGTQAISGITRSAGDSFTMRLRVTGSGTTTLQARLWRTGATEPGSWQLTSTDSTAALQAGGAVGLHGARAASATATGAVSFDDLTVTEVR